jgi:predicted dehydrogenase
MDKIKVGIVGCGGIASKRHFPGFAMQPDVEIAAVCDVNIDCARALADQYKAKHVFSNYEELVAVDELDAVSVCTPNFMHMPPAVAALKAGKHVLVEKPIGRNAAEAQAIVDAARESGKKLMVAQCYRFRSDSQALKRFIDGGAMGEIYYASVQAIRRRGIPSWGVFTDKEKQGGGPLIDMGVHILDCAMWLIGHPKPVAASGAAYTKFGNRPGLVGKWGPWDHTNFTVEDFAAGFVRFDNGATLTIESSFASNIEKDALNLSILGTEGGCQFDPLRIFREEHGTLVDLTPVYLPTVDIFHAEIRAFVDCIVNDTESPVTGEQALHVAKILDAIYESSERGAEVRID